MTSAEDRPRVLALAEDIVGRTECPLDLDQITNSVEEIRRKTRLTMGELWALPVMLRLSVVERLAAAVTLIAEVSRRIDDQPAGDPPTELKTQEALVANAILSLRMLASHDWKAFFENVSDVEEQLRQDPAKSYAAMDFETRDRYRKAVEKLARAVGREEVEVARVAVRLAEDAETTIPMSPRRAHVGFYLVDDGRAELEAEFGYRSAIEGLRRWLARHSVGLYLCSIGLLTVILVGVLAISVGFSGAKWSMGIGVALFVVLPVLAVAVDLVNAAVTHLLAPRLLPKMDFRNGVPEACRTIVVVPSMLSSSGDIETLLGQLESHYLGNADPYLGFALLTDCCDSPQEHMPDDKALIEQASAGIRQLNSRHGTPSGAPFYLFHRRREWNQGEGCWMGWERKRGKLAEFDNLLKGQETTFAVKVGDLDILFDIKYVITLDTDTDMPRGSARALIGTLAHPLNRAEIDPKSGLVVAGYTILQPRIQVKPTSESRSLFARIYSRDVGFDLYTRAVSDVYQDLFGEGNYVGTGIYDVEAFDRSLVGRVVENTILSHDLFEGVHGRTGLVTDVVLLEDYPPNYLAYVQRMHRWIRGDWQLLPWLWRRVPHMTRGGMPNPLSILDQWKILDNLLRSLLGPAIFALLLAGWLFLPGSAIFWTLVGILPLAL
ncbi:MAG: hypothetical protein QNL12_12100, partial [Acidimicrobiia bacterium]|nr:hypothetical protein [Acidimicrobiia bacterium]